MPGVSGRLDQDVVAGIIILNGGCRCTTDSVRRAETKTVIMVLLHGI